MTLTYSVTVYDKPNTSRAEVLDEHIKDAFASVNAGIIASGGAIYEDDEQTSVAGSDLHLNLDSREEVVEFLKKDIFYKAGIWDVDGAIINPVAIAVRLPIKLPGTDEKLYQT